MVCGLWWCGICVLFFSKNATADFDLGHRDWLHEQSEPFLHTKKMHHAKARRPSVCHKTLYYDVSEERAQKRYEREKWVPPNPAARARGEEYKKHVHVDVNAVRRDDHHQAVCEVNIIIP